MKAPELEYAGKARLLLGKVRGRLMRPSIEALNGSAADLEIAEQCLQRLEMNVGSGVLPAGVRQALEADITGIRDQLRVVQALADAAGKFCQWAHLADGAEPGGANYTAAGSPGAAIPGPGKVMIHG